MTKVIQNEFTQVEFSEELGEGGRTYTTSRENINPFPEQAPIHQLQRLRTLTTVTLPGPAAGSYTSIDIAVWQLLTVDPVLQSLLRMFKGISCVVKLEFLTRSTPLQYGAYSISYKYGNGWHDPVAAGVSGRWLGVNERLSSPSHFLDIGNSTAQVLRFPFRFNFPYINPTNAGSACDDYLHVSLINFMCINEGASSNLLVDIFYSLEEIDTGLYTASNLIDVQSKNIVLETAAAVGTKLLFDKVSSLFDSYTPTKSGNVTNVDWQDAGGPASTAKPDGPSFGAETNNMRLSYFGDMSGTRCCNTAANLEPAESTTTVSLYGMPDNYSLRDLCKLPGMITNFRFSSADPVNTKIVIPVCLRNVGLNTAISEVTWAGYYSMFFRFYRGDHKYVFHWYTSTLVAARVQISVQYLREFTTNSLTVAPTAFPSEEMPNQIYQVRGSSEKEVVVPWHAFSQIKRPRDVVALMTVTLIQPPDKSGTADTYIGCMVTHSLHNAHLFSPTPGQYTDPPTPMQEMRKLVTLEDKRVGNNISLDKFYNVGNDTKEARVHNKSRIEKKYGNITLQSDLRLMHAGDKGEFALTGRTKEFSAHLEEVADLFTLFRRWDNDLDLITAPTPILRQDCTLRVSGTNPTFWNDLSLLEQASEPFLFNTGALEIKHVFKSATTGSQFVHINSIDEPLSVRTGLGTAIVNATAQPVFEFVMPYLCTAPVYYRAPGL